MADTVETSLNVASPLNVAVMLRDPNVDGFHVHDATPLRTLVVPHALITVSFSINATVPVVEDGPMTFAVRV